MRFQKLFLLFCLAAKIASSQDSRYAVLKDKEGFINVREKPARSSMVKDTLHSGKIIFFLDELGKEEWYPISYLKNKKLHDGFVHNSRIKFIEKFTPFAVTKRTDSLVEFVFDTLRIVIRAGNFRRDQHKLKFNTNGSTLVSIDNNKDIWGMDGNIPKREYKRIEVSTKNWSITAPSLLWNNVFEPNLAYTSAYYDKLDGSTYLVASNSDGAGGYMILWVIKGREFVDRQIDIPF